MHIGADAPVVDLTDLFHCFVRERRQVGSPQGIFHLRRALGAGDCTRHCVRHQDSTQGHLGHRLPGRHQLAQFLHGFQPLFIIHP